MLIKLIFGDIYVYMWCKYCLVVMFLQIFSKFIWLDIQMSGIERMVLFQNINVGQRVEVKINNLIFWGVVKYKGFVVNKQGDWVGVVLDRVGNDGFYGNYRCNIFFFWILCYFFFFCLGEDN